MVKKKTFVVFVLLCFNFIGFGQLNITSTSTNYTINFDATVVGVNNGQFAGTGFQSAPTSGQLDSDSWAVTGWSDGNLTFGGTRTTAATDYTRGNTAAAVTTGGIYSYGSADRKLMIQPGGSDWAPGTLTLRIQNNTGLTITDFNVAYDLFVRNDQERSNSFNFSYSSDNVTYTSGSSLDYTSIQAADALGMVIVGTKSTSVSSLSIANGAYFYIRWSGADVSGTNNRDEFALDNIVVSGNSTPSPELQLVDNTATNQNCGYAMNFGSKALSTNTDLTFDVKNLGSLDLTVNSLDITGDYTVVSPSTSFTVTTGNSQTVTVRFTPTINGTRSGILTINNNDANEGSCIVNLTGVGLTPAPEINVEGNLGSYPDITNGDGTPSGTDNTLFAAQFIGASQSKSYRINNEGTADLILSAISIGGTNSGDFTITTSPSNTITPSTFSLLEITFSPLGSGERNATVSIVNNDGDKNPFIFAIRGMGNCVSSSLAIKPSSGPVGTTITVTGTNFGASTTATLSGINASLTILSSTTMEIMVPNNATTGNIEVINDLGCTSSILFNVIDKTVGGCEGGSNLSDLIISEVTDATTGGLTYIEIYNGTGGNVQLNNYSLAIYSNGNSTPSNTINPLGPGNLSNNTTYVIAIGVAGTPDTSNTCSITGGNGELATDEYGIGGINKKDNEHDAIRLLKSSWTVVVDQFGIYMDSNWMDSTTITGDRGFNFRRLITASPLPNPNFNLNDWNIIDWAGSGQSSCSTNDYSDIGVYDFSTASPPSITTQPVASSSTCGLSATLTVEANEGYVGENGLTYQWYYLIPGDSDWNVVPNGLPYIGETTNVLDIFDSSGLNGYQYYCQVRENTETCYKSSNTVRLDVYSTTWNGSSWDNGVPDLVTIAIINGDYTTNFSHGSFSACNLIVNENFTLNIADGYNVEVENNVTVDGSITVESQGAFVQNKDSGTFTLGSNGSSQVNKFTSPLPEWRAYTYWSSPVTEVTVGTALPFSIRRYYFDANNYIDADEDGLDDNANDWVPLIDDDVMTPGVGYIASHTNIGFIPNTSYQYLFKGAFNTGPITPLLGFNASNLANWNLVGNPYPCALDIDSFFIENVDDNNNIEGIVYLWSHYSPASAANTYGNEVLNYSFSDYAIINRSGQIAGADKKIPERYIPSGQGFFVNSLSSSYLTFNNSMRKNNLGNIIDNSQFFRYLKTSNDNAARIWLNLTADYGVFNQILITYLYKASDGYDGLSYDAEPVFTGWANIYTSIEGELRQFGIQGRAYKSLTIDETIPIGFNSWIDVPTLYTLSIPQVEGDFLTSNTIYLKDNLLNKVHDLTASDYSFTSEVGEFKDRFEIVFQSESLSDIEAQLNINKLTIIEQNDGRVQLKTNSNHTIKSVQILDLLGRTLYQLKGTSSTEIYNLNNLSQSAYIAKVELSNGQIITKKAINRN